MKITPDTNVLVRLITNDDPGQSRAAKTILEQAEAIALTLPTLCEFTWVLLRGYKIASRDVAEAIKRMTDSANVVVNRAAVDAGLQMLENGGDFAEGVIEFEGRWMGCDVFVSFDRRAVALLKARGHDARIPGSG